MSKDAVLAVLDLASRDDQFLGRLTDSFREAVEPYDLTREEYAALASGDIRWVEAHVGKLDTNLATWLDCRLQQERWSLEHSIEARLEAVLPGYDRSRRELISLLQHVQAEFGYLPQSALLRIADYIRVPESTVFGVASFYGQFRFTPQGKKRVMVCRGTSCHVRGAPRVLDEAEKVLGVKEGETTPNLEYTLETVACIGCCALSPCVMVNDTVHANLTRAKVRELLST
jgi:NADH-quinone oxidoreductase subunit E